MFRMILRRNLDYFREQHQSVGLVMETECDFCDFGNVLLFRRTSCLKWLNVIVLLYLEQQMRFYKKELKSQYLPQCDSKLNYPNINKIMVIM
jgi:hypothetical protein